MFSSKHIEKEQRFTSKNAAKVAMVAVCLRLCGPDAQDGKMWKNRRGQVSNGKKNGCLGYIGDDILPSYIRIILNKWWLRAMELSNLSIFLVSTPSTTLDGSQSSPPRMFFFTLHFSVTGNPNIKILNL